MKSPTPFKCITQRRIRLRLCRFAVRKGLPFRQLLFFRQGCALPDSAQPRRSLGKIEDDSGRPQAFRTAKRRSRCLTGETAGDAEKRFVLGFAKMNETPNLLGSESDDGEAGRGRDAHYR